MTPLLPLLLLLPSTFASAPVSRYMLGVNACCPEGQTLEMSHMTIPGLIDLHPARCVKSSNDSSSFEWKTLMVLDPTKDVDGSDRFVEMSLIRNKQEKNLQCGNSITTILRLNVTDNDSSSLEEDIFRPRDPSIELQGGNTPNEGNVYLEGRPICDDSWEQPDADVACRMLGYSWGQPVKESRYGSGHSYIMDDVDCEGHERSLWECRYNSDNNCGNSEVAGVICGTGERMYPDFNDGNTSDITHSLNLDGGVTEDESGEEYLAPGTFCVAARDEETVMAVQCKPSQVLPALLGHVYKEGERHPDYVYWPSLSNYIRYGDTDGDSLLSESEFISIVKNLLRDIFDVLDDDKDQTLEVKPTVEDPSFPFVVFEKTLKHIFKFFDLNEDNIISVNDDLRDLMQPRERFSGDVLTIGDITGSEPITWPYPFFKLYSLIDPNRDEKVTFEEALAFLTKAFLMFDRNENSYVSIMEVVNTLEINGGLPKKLVVAIEILLEKYNYLGQFIINEIVSGADKDNDGKATFNEIFTFDDWDLVANSLIRAALRVGYPTKGPINLLINQEYRLDDPYSRRRIHPTSSVINNWMKALLGLLNGM